jgi:hypothetical protein
MLSGLIGGELAGIDMASQFIAVITEQTTKSNTLEVVLPIIEEIALKAEEMIITDTSSLHNYYWFVVLSLGITAVQLSSEAQSGQSVLAYLFIENDDQSVDPIDFKENFTIPDTEVYKLIMKNYNTVYELAQTDKSVAGGRNRIKHTTVSKKHKKSKHQSKHQSKRRVKKFKTVRKKKIESGRTKRRSKK